MPEAVQEADLLTAAAVALNRHAALLRELGSVFAAAGHELYLVGGSVRDALLGRLSPDLDFTTDARPERVQEIVRPWADAVWDTGIEFGTVGVGKSDHRMEITTFRADSYDRVSRHPEVRFGDCLEGDLVRRDFTTNAMAVRVTATGPGEFLDPLGGLAALRAKVLDTRRRRRGPLATIRCGCCAPRGSSRNLDSRWRRGCARRSKRWRRSWPESAPNGWPPSWTSCWSVRIRPRVST